MRNYTIGMMGLAALALAVNTASAALYRVTGGSAAITILEGTANSINEFDALFDAATTRAQSLALAAPGNAPFTETPTDPGTGSVSFSDAIRPFGEAPLNDAGGTTPGVPGASRTRQATTLEFDSDDLTGSWSASNDSFGFTGNTTLGEQIALTSMTRFTGPFPGALLYGDFALRYTGSKLRLTTNIDFLNAEFAEVSSPVFNITPTTLTISGPLLIDEGLAILDGTAIPGTNLGTFVLSAEITPVPEPTSLAVLAVAAMASLRRR